MIVKTLKFKEQVVEMERDATMHRDVDLEGYDKRKAYYREYNKKWYQVHKERLFEKRKQHHAKMREWLQQYKSKLCCVQCGESHPSWLQFHHRNREEKSFNVGKIIGGWRYITIKKLESEIEKCDILCGNCHAMYHWKETHSFDSWLDME